MHVCSFVTSLIISSIPRVFKRLEGVASSFLGPLPNDGGSDGSVLPGVLETHNLLVILAHKTEFV